MTDTAAPANDTVDIRKLPYPGFGTFQNFLERLSKQGVPDVIDRQFIGGSGGTQSLMLGALTFLGLVDDETNKPTRTLEELAIASEEDRAAIYRRLVVHNYSGALELGAKASQGQLDAWFRQQGLTGDTSRKAQSFFLSLAKAGGVEVSPFFKPTRSSSAAAKKRAPARRRPDELVTPPANTPPSALPGPGQIHPAVVHLLDKIPAPGTPWSKSERDLLVETFGNLLDLFHPVAGTSSGDGEGEPET